MKKTQNRTGCLEMVGPDVQIDQRGGARNAYEPANPLPVLCPHCTFPDLNFISQPYVLTKAASSELCPAQIGNFLVRANVQRILEIVVPGECTFYPTIEKKTKKFTEWSLAVPIHVLEVPGRDSQKPFCPKCGEPKDGYVITDRYVSEIKQFDSQGLDVFKSRRWCCNGTTEDHLESINRSRAESGIALQPWSDWGVEAPTHPERWTRRRIGRDLFFSIRLEQLLKRAKIKAQLVRAYDLKELQPTPEDLAWVEEKYQLLVKNGLVDGPKAGAAVSGTAQKWLKSYLKRNATKSLKVVDFDAIEKKQKLALPQDYKDFISTVGPKSFEDVNDTEGFTANVLPPQKIDFNDYRRGKVPYLEGEQAEIDGVMFATTDHGDAFVFDVSAKGPDYPVFWHAHEENTLEPFAPNFAECIKRFEKGH